MALGRRRRGPVQEELFVASADLPRSMGHPFYRKLDGLLTRAKFDDFVEELVRPSYAEFVGRPGVAAGIYFRMLFVGYFEDIGSQRGIAWKCSDSLSLREFLGLRMDEGVPDHSSMTRTRVRLSESVHDSVFAWVLGLCAAEGLLTDPKEVAVDSTTLGANAAMKSIVRKATGEDYKTYIRGLMRAEGIEDPTDEEVIKFDRKRANKTMSNADWESPADPDARIARMKDKTTKLAYKAEVVVDLASDVIVAAEVYCADDGDSRTYVESVMAARTHLDRIELPDAAAQEGLVIESVVLDKGYHGAESLEMAAWFAMETYAAEPERTGEPQPKPAAQEEAVAANRKRMKGKKAKALHRKRSEYAERTFAHTCGTGGARRCWVRGLKNVRKRYPMTAAARNLGTLMRFLYGIGTPKKLQDSLSDEEKAKFEAEGGPRRAFRPYWRSKSPNSICGTAVRDSKYFAPRRIRPRCKTRKRA